MCRNTASTAAGAQRIRRGFSNRRRIAAGAKRFGQGLMFRTVRITRLYPGRKCKETVRRNAGRRGAHFSSGMQEQGADRPPERRAARGAFSSGVGQGSVNSGGLHRQALSKGTDISPPALQAAGRFLLLPAFPSLPARRAAHLYKGRYRLEARFARFLKQKLIFPHQRLYAEAA